MRHTIKNKGPGNVIVLSRNGVETTVRPTEEYTTEVSSIMHGRGRMSYTVEPETKD